MVLSTLSYLVIGKRIENLIQITPDHLLINDAFD